MGARVTGQCDDHQKKLLQQINDTNAIPLTYSVARALPISPTKEHPGGRHSCSAYPNLHLVVLVVAVKIDWNNREAM